MNLIKAEKQEHSKYVLEFKIDAETFAASVDKVARRDLKKFNIPGFRKGKAPRSVVEKMYGKGIFYEDALNDALPAAYEEAVAEAAITPVSRPEFDVVSMDDAEGVTLKAEVYVKPEVSITDYLGMEAVQNKVVATDDEVNAEIDRVRQQNSRETEVTDRAAQLDDVVNIDYEGFCDGTAFEGGKADGAALKLGSGQFIPGFEDQIVGHAIGDEFDVNVTFPEEYHAAELAGKAAVFKVKLNGINVVELPAVDDEFAKDVSEFDTIDEYKADLKAKIQSRHDANTENDVKDQLLQGLVEKLDADIPEAMFDTEVENVIRDYDTRLRMQGMSLDMYFKYTGLDLDTMRQQARPQAERQVKTRLALEKIAELENIEVSDEDLNAEIKRIADNNHITEDQVKEIVGAEAVREDVKVERALDLVREKAVLTEKKAEEAAATEAPAAEKKPAKKTTRKTTKKKTEPKVEDKAEDKVEDNTENKAE